MRWWDSAACADEDPDLFFPVGESGPAAEQYARAKAVCRRCPVRVECLDWALRTGTPSGVWGGLGEAERKRIRRHRAEGAAGGLRGRPGTS